MLWIIRVTPLMHRPLEQMLYFVGLLAPTARKSAKRPMYKYRTVLAGPLECERRYHR